MGEGSAAKSFEKRRSRQSTTKSVGEDRACELGDGKQTDRLKVSNELLVKCPLNSVGWSGLTIIGGTVNCENE